MEILIKGTQEEFIQTLDPLRSSQPGDYKDAAPQHEENEWRRFEEIAETEVDKKELGRIIREKNLSRQDLATILFNLRVRPGFQKEDFGI